jgi:drug/metabolite transporter (DMT)-like permease
MLLPFGALVFGAALYSEEITLRALAGAALVAVGLLIAQAAPGARRVLRGLGVSTEEIRVRD